MVNVRKIPSIIVALILVLTLTIGSAAAFAPTAEAAAKITVTVDGTKISTDVNPVSASGDVLVSLQTVSYGFGADTKYNSSSKQITVSTAAYKFVFTVGSKSYKLNGSTVTGTVAPKLVSKKPMVPLKVIAQAIGGSFSFKSNKATVSYFSKMSGTIKIDGSTTIYPIANDAAKALMKLSKKVSISVSGGGSGAGIKDVIAGNVNLGNSSRVLTSEEKSQIAGVYTIAQDGIAIIVNPKNTKIKKLTSAQAKDIFLGKITNWSQVGGDNAAIIVETRESNSGTLSTLSDLLLSKASVTSKANVNNSSGLMKQSVAANKYAIGFDSIGFLDKTVKAVGLDNIMPTVANVKSGSYLLGRDLFTLSKAKATGVSAMYIDYLKTKACQSKIVAKDGYIAIK